jgi:hypothetical protein
VQPGQKNYGRRRLDTKLADTLRFWNLSRKVMDDDGNQHMGRVCRICPLIYGGVIVQADYLSV